ncbi:hypothetical protein J2T12_005524 [Paenibacillus anaericanus]|uniref:hypothetical protein n=1 Tax=Paenibacillus anaericanus TaxID=170367 RepID=UPI00277FAA1B|nr:hypothetical protein [Paenibacillus anaericanus]MDQ0092080.1 hypothetical protein [Paenibacillus anaericanus]
MNDLGYEFDKAKEILIDFYRPVKRTCGFNPNSRDFAMIVHELNKTVHESMIQMTLIKYILVI